MAGTEITTSERPNDNSQTLKTHSHTKLIRGLALNIGRVAADAQPIASFHVR